jgi:hypothetical protein
MTARPLAPLNLDALPPELTAGRRAVAWTVETRNGKETKVPRVPREPTRKAKVNDASTWDTLDQAIAVVNRGQADGVGRVLGDGLVVIDLDKCRDAETGAITTLAKQIINECDSYTELSPSGTGVHIWCRGSVPTAGRRRQGIELYADGRFMTITGLHLAGTRQTVEERSAELRAIYDRFFEPDGSTSDSIDDDSIAAAFESGAYGGRARQLWLGDLSAHGGDHSAADLALCNRLAGVTNGNATQIDRLFRRSGLMRPKWDEKRGERTYGERTIAVALDERTSGPRSTRPRHTKRSKPDSAAKADPPAGQSTGVVKLALEKGVELFADDDVPYIAVPIASHFEVYPLRSKRAKNLLASEYFELHQKVPSSQATADALNVLEALALRAPRRDVAVRIARFDERIYVDLGDADWRAIEIDDSGWRVVTRPPVPFRRPRGLQPLPEPIHGGSILELQEYLNVSNDDDFVLIVSFALGVLGARKPYPILVINGEHGSAKSTTTAILRLLTDPNAAPLRAEPRDAQDLMIAASNAHVLSYDNLSNLRLADEFARLATGAGFATRTLFENREEEIFSAARPIILNGIPELATRADLMSRSLFVTLPPITSRNRLDETTFWARFQSARPRILGALLNAVSAGLRRQKDVVLPVKPRMADFAMWISACEPGCPWPPGHFMRVYEANRRGAVDAVLDGNIVADTAVAIAPWCGTATDFLRALNARAPVEAKHNRDWFKHPRQVRDALQRLAPALRESGLNVVLGLKDSSRHRTRLIRLEPVSVSPSGTSATSETETAEVESIGRTVPTSAASSSSPSDHRLNPVEALDDSDDSDAIAQSESRESSYDGTTARQR